MAPETRKLVKKMNCTWKRLIFWSYVLYGDDFENLLMTTFDFVPRRGTDAVINYHANICREH